MSQPIYLNCTNYQRAEPLKAHIGNDPIAASVADIILYKWQNSQITFKGGKACCPTLDDIACAVGVSVKTVTRKIVKLVKLGLISKTLGRWANGATRLYFKVTDLFVGLITGEIKKDQKETKKSPQTQCSSDLDKLSKSTKTNCPSPIDKEKERKKKKEKNNNPMVANKEPKEGGNTKNNAAVTVNFQQVEKEVSVIKSSTKPTVQNAAKPTEKPKDAAPYIIDEKLTKRQIAIVHGAVNNLMKDGVPVSNPKQLKAEVVFKIEQKHKDAGDDNLQHQINSAMKLVRAGKWTTPHGFFKYAEVGRKAVKKREEAERTSEESKYDVSVPILPDHFKDLLKLDLSGVGQGEDTVRANGHNADTLQNKSCVFDSNRADTNSQLVTENDAAGTTRLSQGGSMGLSRSDLVSEKSSPSAGITKAQSRMVTLNASIARCQAKLAVVSGSAKDALLGLIQRLNDELQSLACAC